MSVINANPLMLGDAGYNIQRSLRFRSSASAYLSRTPASAGNRQKFTWSGWVKRGTGGSTEVNKLFTAYTSGTNETTFGFGGGDTIRYYDYQGSYNAHLVTTPVYRDFSGWYHLVLAVDTTDATSTNRVKIYVNGAQVTALGTAVYPSQNSNTLVDATNSHYIASSSYGYFDGYLAEVNFIDGQALTPSSFGQTDAVTGVWTPKKYTGTYGTNGFYLPFSDNTSATTLAYDKSGNGNNWTPNNISTTAGATYDSMTDVPTLTSATAANYCVLNPLNKGSDITLTSGNLQYSSATAASYSTCLSTFGMTSGQWYWEVAVGSSYHGIGIAKEGINLSSYPGNTNGWAYVFDGTKQGNGSGGVAYGASYTTNDIIGVAFDADAGTLTFYKNNSSQGTAFTGLTSSPYFPSIGDSSSGGTISGNINFGQRPFSYTPPTGFKALNTFNLPDPTIKKPNQYMDATLYTGNGSALTVTNTGSFQPDLVWTKSRSNAYSNCLIDSSRGVSNALISNATNAEDNNSGYYVTAFNSNGFSVGLGTGSNGNGATYVGWQWKKGATPGFDIVTYTGTGFGTEQVVPHSLGVTPAMMIVKSRSSTQYWIVQHQKLTGITYNLYLNGTDSQQLDNQFTGKSATNVTVYGGSTNGSGINYVMYLFAEIPGFSKFGSYTGNGSADGPFVYCGFRPKYLLYKRTDTTGEWAIWDAARNPNNATDKYLWAQSANAEGTFAAVDMLSNGFKLRTNDPANNANGGTFIYAAFAESPQKFSLAR